MKLALILIDRANYGRLVCLIDELLWVELSSVQSLCQLQVICGGSMLLERFKRPVDLVEQQLGRPVDYRVWCAVEGSTPGTTSRSIAAAIQGFTDAYEQLRPDAVVIIGDRHEAVAAAVAATYCLIPIVHIQGGERSGCLDNRARDVITRLATWHCPATSKAADRLCYELGVAHHWVLTVGCPSADLAATITPNPGQYVLVQYHPVTTRYGEESFEIEELFYGVIEWGLPIKWLWPNIDAGSEHIHKHLRELRTAHPLTEITWIRNLDPQQYQQLLADAAVAIGNSSSFVRDSSFYGTPVLLVGDRQRNRECGLNVKRGPVCRHFIAQQAHLPYVRRIPSNLYGYPGISQRIAERIMEVVSCKS